MASKVFDTALPDQIPVETINYLFKIYQTLAITSACCGVGVVIQIITQNSVLILLGCILSFALTISLKMGTTTVENSNQRVCQLYAIGASLGFTLGPLLSAALSIDSAIVSTAIAGTITIFGCFSILKIRGRFYTIYIINCLYHCTRCLILTKFI